MNEQIEHKAEKALEKEAEGNIALWDVQNSDAQSERKYWKEVWIMGYKSGHNAALSEAIEKIKEKYMTGYEMYPSDYLGILEGLKIKP